MNSRSCFNGAKSHAILNSDREYFAFTVVPMDREVSEGGMHSIKMCPLNSSPNTSRSSVDGRKGKSPDPIHRIVTPAGMHSVVSSTTPVPTSMRVTDEGRLRPVNGRLCCEPEYCVASTVDGRCR